MLKDIIQKNRSYRRFYEDHVIDEAVLRELIELARLSPSGSNLQPLKYILSYSPEKNEQIFPQLGWAGYLKDWPGPEVGERPSAYIIILGDKNISNSFDKDLGIAGQSILLGATEKGLGGCMLGNVKRQELRKILNIPEQYEILLVIALGKPKENVIIETVGPEGDVKYWHDDERNHHVPKRILEDIIIGS
ncbi:MAG: nitroreductase family protein [Clostridiales bacterium]|jgi:nitroreductase|nr:nitroreductase family protein [Clostridiales bacterium]